MADRDADHLAALLLEGGAAGGAYTPERITLALSGVDRLMDHVIYLHELHHRGLNDTTAWGAALQLFAELPDPYHACFLPLLDACRLPHEAFAMFASVNIASARHERADAILEVYAGYKPLFEGVLRMVKPAGGPHREYLLATALARLAMQTPVLDVLLGSRDFMVRPADLRAIDTPDGRWRWFLQRGTALTAAAAAAGDDALAGSKLPALDDGTRDEVAADLHDEAWGRWERAAYGLLAERLRQSGATPLEFDGHMATTPLAVARALEVAPRLRLRAARQADPAPDDRALAGSAIEDVRLTLAREPYEARLLPLAVEDVVAVVDERCRIAGQPTMVLSVRLPSRLLASYRWDEPDRAELVTRRDPLVSARVLEVDGETVTVAHLTFDAPEEIEELTSRWAGRGPAVTIVTASALIDRAWQERWMPAIRAVGRVVVLIDVVLDRFVDGWVRSGSPLSGGVIQVNDTSAGYWAAGIATPGHPELWLVLADEITIRLFLEQLRRTPGLRFTQETAHLERWTELLPVVTTHLLATESFFDVEGLDEATRIRFREAEAELRAGGGSQGPPA